MAKHNSPILLIDRGDLPSLTAAIIQPDPARLILWHLREADEAAARRAAIVKDHADFLGAADLIISDAWQGDVGRASDVEGLWQALLLVQAAIIARHRGCDKIIWPIQVGPDAARVSELVDRATAVAELAESGTGAIGQVATSGTSGTLGTSGTSGGRAMVIDLPLVDLDDEQVVDLADDAGAPLRAFWPCETAGVASGVGRAATSGGGGGGRAISAGGGGATSGGGEPCGACGGCDRWLRAFRECGLPWPWTAVRV